jgi:UDP-N-acetyl-D-galactosamine dehydrogenase
MANRIAQKVVMHIIKTVGNVKSAKVLVKGATFKENVSDIRNSKVADVVKALQKYYLNVDVEDPYADSDELQHEYGFRLADKISNDYDAVIITVPHKPYLQLDENYFSSITKEDALIADIKGMYRNKISKRNYWSL